MSYREFVNKAIGKSLSSFHRTFIGLEAIESNNKVQDLNLDRILAIAKDGTIELSANGFSITLDKATRGQAEVTRVEGFTLVNFSEIEEERNITNKYDDIVGNGKALDTVDNEVISLGEIVGNTMVNYSNVKDATPSTSYDTIIGNEGQLPTVEGEVIRPTEIIGNTALNLSKTKELTPVTYKFNDIVEMNRGNLEGAIDGTLEIESIEGNTLHNLSSIKESTPVTHKFADIIGNEGILEGVIEGTCEVEQIVGDTLVNLCNIGNEPITHAYEDVVEGNDYQLPTVKGEYICVDNVVGDTLVNLANADDLNAENQDLIDFYDTYRLTKDLSCIKSATVYTIIFNVDIQCSTEHNYKSYTVGYGTNTSLMVKEIRNMANELHSGVNVATFTTFTSEEQSNYNFLSFRPLRKPANDTTNIQVTYSFNNVILLEGDYTNKPIPQEAFEGLQSSFENGLVTDENNENYGKYKVDAKVRGKNLFNEIFLDKILANENLITTLNSDGSLTFNGTLQHHHSFNVTIPKGTYRPTTFSDSSAVLHVFWYGGDTYFQQNKILSYTEDVTLQCYIAKGTYDNYICKFQLEEGTVATPYEPCYEQTQTLYLNSPLLKGDKLVSRGDGVYHVHNMGKVVLDGSEDEGWGGSKIENSCVRMAIYKLAKDDSFIICDKFTANINTYYNNEEGIIIDGGGSLYLGISINKLSTPDVTGFKAWLQANPTTIAYELATPWEEKVLDHRLTLECPDNANILMNSNIPVQSYGFTNLSNSIDLLQPNKQYTLQIECDKDITTKFTFLGEVNENYTLNKGFNKILFTTSSTITNRDIVFEGKEGIISTVLLEGDYTEKPNLEYFEGMQSSYECERSKNLFDKTKLINYDGNHKLSDYISVKPNTSYRISGRPIFNLDAPTTATRFCFYYDINKQLISSENTNNPRTPKNCYYMQITLRVDNKDKPDEFTDDLNLIQLEEGTVATEYEPYGYKVEVKAYNPYNATDLIAKLKGGANQ